MFFFIWLNWTILDCWIVGCFVCSDRTSSLLLLFIIFIDFLLLQNFTSNTSKCMFSLSPVTSYYPMFMLHVRFLSHIQKHFLHIAHKHWSSFEETKLNSILCNFGICFHSINRIAARFIDVIIIACNVADQSAVGWRRRAQIRVGWIVNIIFIGGEQCWWFNGHIDHNATLHTKSSTNTRRTCPATVRSVRQSIRSSIAAQTTHEDAHRVNVHSHFFYLTPATNQV